ncbi:hypothetical protein NKI30_33015 [Mesorhizobium opportunistum]|uniref:IS4/Tn5 family transposase DNA-binding protein n=1 Tax=Mesorhizobium opportunistum TaxID=593909 RepID=UPI003335A19F
MRHKTSSGEAAWQEEELSTAALPDKSLARCLRRLLDQMSAAPGKPIPAACGDWAAAKAAYRFFDNPRVTEHGVLAGHFAATAARVAASEGPILILQDTTEFIYGRAQPGKIGFTKTINAGRYKAGQPNVLTLCGTMMHSSLAVTLTGTPLGLTAVKFWTRTKFKGTLALKRHINPTRVPIETKESYRWLENLRQSIALMGAPERCVHVGDRESDIYELYCAAQDLGTSFIVRVQTNRLADVSQNLRTVALLLAHGRQGVDGGELHLQPGRLVLIDRNAMTSRPRGRRKLGKDASTPSKKIRRPVASRSTGSW